MAKVLLVDAAVSIQEGLRLVLHHSGHELIPALSGKEALQALDRSRVDVVLLDLRLPDMNGLLLLNSIRHLRPRPSAIVITGHPTIDSCVEAMRSGASHYLEKPVDTDHLLSLVASVVETRSGAARHQEAVINTDDPPGTHQRNWRPTDTKYAFVRRLAETWDCSVNSAVRRIVRRAMRESGSTQREP